MDKRVSRHLWKNVNQYFKRVEKFSGNRISFKDGKEAAFDAVILATGYRPRVNDFIQGISSVFDEAGAPTSTGKESSSPGLYFCGYYVSPTGMLREIAIEARQVSAAIAEKYAY
jgi:indole-3-pyruvate monooxygenase